MVVFSPSLNSVSVGADVQGEAQCGRSFGMELTDDVIRSYKVAAVVSEFTEKVNCISYSFDGSMIASSCDDDSIVLFDALKGSCSMTIPCKRHGAEHVTYTHSTQGLLHASRRGGDDLIRYLNVREVKYIRAFAGHTRRITGLMMAPCDDRFMSVSEDKTMRIWDLKTPNTVGQLEAPARPVAAFDPEGLVFAVGYRETLKFYDLRAYDKGPFLTAMMPREQSCDWTGMKFSDDGTLLLLSTNASIIRVVDAYEGSPKMTLSGHTNNKGIPLEASFSPDSKYVFSGSTDGKVHVWHASTGLKVPFISHEHPGPVQCIKFSPRYHSFACACSVLSVWSPYLPGGF